MRRSTTATRLLTLALASLCSTGPTGAVDGAAQADQPPNDRPRWTSTEIAFRNVDVELTGTLVLPAGPPPHPAIVFLHGSGPATRDGALTYAKRYAELGFAGLAFDKRGGGGSGGSWTSASLEDLARDAVAAVDYLVRREDIDSGQIGFWGVSQAGWVATEATRFTDDVGFMVIISGGGVTPYESEMFSYRTALERAGLSAEDTAAGLALVDRYFDYLGTGEGRDELEAAIASAEGKVWFDYVRVDRILPASEDGRRTWSWVANWDPRPLMEKITIPVLLLFGGQDTETPATLSAERWRQSLARAGNERFTIRMFPEAGHAIRTGHHGAQGERPPFADGYHAALDDWLRGLLNSP